MCYKSLIENTVPQTLNIEQKIQIRKFEISKALNRSILQFLFILSTNLSKNSQTPAKKLHVMQWRILITPLPDMVSIWEYLLIIGLKSGKVIQNNQKMIEKEVS